MRFWKICSTSQLTTSEHCNWGESIFINQGSSLWLPELIIHKFWLDFINKADRGPAPHNFQAATNGSETISRLYISSQSNVISNVAQVFKNAILMPPCFHIAHLKRYVPNISGVPQKLTWRNRFGLQLPPKWHDLNRVPPKKWIFRPFFVENNFFRPNGPLSPYTCYTYSESLACWPSNELLWTNASASCDASEFCWQTLHHFLQYLRPCHTL